jgi:hypothetical protein
MTWSYNIATLATTPKDQVRRLIGDVIATDQQMGDEEINFALTLRPGVYGPAAECARMLAAQFGRKADVVTSSPGGGQLKTNYSIQATRYMALANELDEKAAIFGAMPYAGGISQADKETQEQNSDRVTPQFNLGMMDNLNNPEGPVGNQTPDSPGGLSGSGDST